MTELEHRRERIAELEDVLRAIVAFCDDPSGSEKGESLALGLSRLLPAARSVLNKETNRGEPKTSDQEQDDVCTDHALAHPCEVCAALVALHRDVMNLPCRVPFPHNGEPDESRAYKLGHRDARHAAAELALSYGVRERGRHD